MKKTLTKQAELGVLYTFISSISILVLYGSKSAPGALQPCRQMVSLNFSGTPEGNGTLCVFAQAAENLVKKAFLSFFFFLKCCYLFVCPWIVFHLPWNRVKQRWEMPSLSLHHAGFGHRIEKLSDACFRSIFTY